MFIGVCSVFSRFGLLRRAARVLACAGVIALVGCSAKAPSGPTQVVATVSGEEITELQVNQALERQPGLKPDQVEPVSRKLVAGLVEQEVVLQKARDLKLDRDQRVVQNVEAAKRDVIVRAYLERIAEGTSKPSTKDIQAYFEGNPALFKQRRIYTFQELSVQVSDTQKKEIEKQLTSLRSAADLEAFLKEQKIPARVERTTAAAENIPLPLLQRVSSLKPGQGLIVPANGGVRIVLLVSAQEAPVSEEKAAPAIGAFLLSQRKRQAVEKEVSALRATAKVEYFGKYAGMAASGAAPSLSASSPASGLAPSASVVSTTLGAGAALATSK
jgi:EpsD family peptidyl-prolyl cis-trans isomerase